jgi:replicative DNA helicase
MKKLKISLNEITYSLINEAVSNLEKLKIGKETIELKVISSMITSEENYLKILQYIKETDFSDEENRLIFSSIVNAYKSATVIDSPELLLLWLKKDKVLEKIVPSKIAKIQEYYLEQKSQQLIVKETRLLKELSIEVHAKDLLSTAFAMVNANKSNEDVFEWINGIRGKLDEMIELKNITPTDTRTIAKQIAEEERINKEKGRTPGVSTGFLSIDQHTGGWGKTNLILIAGRPGMGKTACVVSMIQNYLFKSSIPFAFFSLEMRSSEIIKRIFSAINHTNLNKITAGAFSEEEMRLFQMVCKTMPEHGHLIDNIYSIDDIETKTEALVINKGVKIIVIDYLQLITGGNGNNMNEKVGNVSQRLKRLAKKLDVPIIALSQLSRITKRTDNKKAKIEDFIPDLEDLRDSGSLEQDADMVCFLFRPDYYKDKVDVAPEDQDKIMFIFKKFRGGSPFTKKMTWQKAFAYIEDPQIAENELSIELNRRFNNSSNEYSEEENDSNFMPIPGHIAPF